jgi:hypothetical protein
MGLDMYLTKRHDVKRWDFMGKAEHYEVTATKGGQPANWIKPERVTCVTEEVAYWRKANEIHAWFVKNCQDGENDCREYGVSRDQLRKLLADCRKVIAAPADASEILPTSSGFFFGGTEYDEYYFEDIRNTIRMLEEILAEPETPDADFYYRASW